MSVDPWYDYLALPVAPLVLCIQFLLLAVKPRRLRLAISIACTSAIAIMFAFAVALTKPADANIGAGLLIFQLVASVAILRTAFRRA